MKLNRPILLSASLIILFVGAGFTLNNGGDNAAKEALLLKTMMDGFKNHHFSPVKVDDEFSKKLFDLYLQRLDGGKRFLVADDVKQLAQYEKRIDDEISDASYEFFDLSVLLYEAGVQRAKGYYEDALGQSFDFSQKGETIELDGEKREYASSYTNQKARWERIIKYEMMTRINSATEKQEEELKKKAEDREADFEEKSAETIKKEAKEDVKKVFDNWFKRLEGVKRKDRLDLYLNSIASLYDPHSSYYAPVEKQNFDISMSGRLEGIGARLQSDGEVTKIVEVVVGGPAWKQGELKAKDVITKVAQGEEEPVDISGMGINEVVSYIRGKKGTEVRLTVRQADGTEKIIPIVRDIVIMDEGYAKSLLLDYKDENAKIKNVGYIKLPRFYADFRDRNGRQCARDVATEIKKLKKQGVKSIILDLRDNGGGSLRDVVEMSGLFIEEGPIVQVKGRNLKPRVMGDTDDGVLFGGDLIIMVNQFSASASEILAAAMQDYNRAVIIGSNSTFGKGTVQRFIDLDEEVWGNNEVKPLGAVKMTIQKFYRINGGTTQLKGVVPDIILPDTYQHIDLGEKEYDYAMEYSQIKPVEYSQNVNRVENMGKLRKNSQKRVTANETFQLINQNAQRFKDVRDDTDYSLNMEEYQAERESEIAEAEKYEGIMENPIKGLTVSNLSVDVERINSDEGKKDRNKKWVEGVEKDVYIQEALMILKDMSE